jgi:predicted lipid-binding transport protein (Tim44 family)
MRRFRLAFAMIFAATLALAPGLADARAGASSSMGSRGSRTYSAPSATTTAPSVAAPMQRSMTPQQSAPSGAPFGSPAPAARPGLFGGSPFMSGLMGGLIGAGIGGMLFGHSAFGGMSGFAGFLGLLLQIFVVVMLVRWAFRWFMRRQQPAMAGGPNVFGRDAEQAPLAARSMNGSGGYGGQQAAPPVNVSPADFQQFEHLLQTVQAAWSHQDLASLQTVATPEMVSYFAEQLSTQTSRGVRNAVTAVKLEQGDLSEAWAENGRDYATVAMRFSMIDVTTDTNGRVVEGDPNKRTQATEVWTFVRANGGQWILSAIQQAG